MDPTLCYLTILTTQNEPAGTYEIPYSRGAQLSTQCGFFRTLFQQYAKGAMQSGPTPTIQTPIPSPQTFDILLHWFYHHSMTAVHKALGDPASPRSTSQETFFGLVRNAAHLGVDGQAGAAFWDVLAAWVAGVWNRGLRDSVKWTWTIVPVALAARAAIAVGGGGIGGDMMSKWASGDHQVAERGVKEVRDVLALYRTAPMPPASTSSGSPGRSGGPVAASTSSVYDGDYDDDEDDAQTQFDPEEEDLGGFVMYEPGGSTSTLSDPNMQERLRAVKKKRRGLLRKFKDLMVKEENNIVATVVVVRDADGRIIDERVLRH
ncbi:hypothetical protein HKX48_000778 [Thoreauomyces humboldtii]|nr:hypothetical protein HKX48_000778 [Thoreauomyces humboldtii]